MNLMELRMTHPLCQMAADGVITPSPIDASLASVRVDTRTGIYAIWMPADAKHRAYIGQAGRRMNKRWSDHRTALRAGAHRCTHLQAAYNKYGSAAFVWAVLEELPADTAILTEAEQAYMDIVGADRLFNTAPAAGSQLGIKRSAGVKARDSVLAAERMRDPVLREKVAAGVRAHFSDPEARAAHAERASARWAAPGADSMREAASRKTSAFYAANPDAVADMAARQKVRFADPELRARISEAQKKRYADPAARAQNGAAQKKRFEDPAARAHTAVKQREVAAARTPEQVAAYVAECRATREARTPEQVEAHAAKLRAAQAARTPEQVASYVAKCKATREAKKLAASQS
jgi:group I intron endonuclease